MKYAMVKYVIQKHSHRDNPVHWDLMIQSGDKLLTWRIDLSPSELREDVAVKAVVIADHELRFLDYQGAVNNGLGSVEIADKGECKILRQDQSQIEVMFSGKVLSGKHIFITQ